MLAEKGKADLTAQQLIEQFDQVIGTPIRINRVQCGSYIIQVEKRGYAR